MTRLHLRQTPQTANRIYERQREAGLLHFSNFEQTQLLGLANSVRQVLLLINAVVRCVES
jgi:hypothetical protein